MYNLKNVVNLSRLNYWPNSPLGIEEQTGLAGIICNTCVLVWCAGMETFVINLSLLQTEELFYFQNKHAAN